MSTGIEGIEQRLTSIESKLDRLLNIHDEIVKSNERLETHINFIESVYSQLKIPIDFVSRKFSIFTRVGMSLFLNE